MYNSKEYSHPLRNSGISAAALEEERPAIRRMEARTLPACLFYGASTDAAALLF
jgi:predicted GNAT family acetyltransferase